MNNSMKYTFVGGGSMASAILTGLIKSGVDKKQIVVNTKTQETSEKIIRDFGVFATTDKKKCHDSDIFILAVKPQDLAETLTAFDFTNIASSPLFISVIAGVSVKRYHAFLGEDVRVIRTMPNTPSKIGEGITGLYANINCSDADKELASNIMKNVGDIIWFETEKGIDWVNAISGSGPAYFYAFMRSIASAGSQLGLSYDDALKLTIQTAKGAVLLAEKESNGTPESLQKLIDEVASKGGTTYEAIRSFEKNNLDDTVEKAIDACFKRIQELSKDY